MSHPRALLAALVSALVLLATGCGTTSTSTAPPSPPPTVSVDTTDMDPRIVRLYALEAQLLSTTDSARVGGLLDQAMAELATLLESDPDLIQRTDVRELYRGLTAEYRRFHGYGSDPDSLVTARGSIFAVRAKLFATLEGVDDVVRALTLHMGPYTLVLNMELHFRDGLDAEGVEQAIDRMERAIREAHGNVKYIFIEAESLSGRTRDEGHAAQ
jgi:hypothetical protein